MTEQYQKININAPVLPLTISGVGTFVLTPDNSFVVISSGAPIITLPDARILKGGQVVIKSTPGAGIVNALSGQTIDELASFNFTVAQQTLFLMSDGANWFIIADEAISSDGPFVTVAGGGTLPNLGYAVATGTPINVPLANVTNGPVTIKNISAAPIALTRGGADTLDGLTAITLLVGDALTLKSDGTSVWRSFLEQPTQDNVFDSGAIATRWANTFSRISHSASLTGAGTNTRTYGVNNVGLFSGTLYSVAGGVASVVMTNPASPHLGPSLIAGGSRVDLTGGIATTTATGVGAKVMGFARAETADTAILRATGDYSLAGGGSRAFDNNATIEATGESSFAFGYARSYGGTYGAVTLSATAIGAWAGGAAQYFSTITAGGIGSMSHGRAFGLGDREAFILAPEAGAFTHGMAAGGTLTSTGIGSLTSGYARSSATGARGTVQATGAGATAMGTANSNAYNATIQATAIGGFAQGYVSTIAGDTAVALIEASGIGPSAVIGGAFYGGSILRASAEGAFVVGIALGYNTGIAEIIASFPGSFAGGLSAGTGGSVGQIHAYENGTIAFGKAVGGTIEAVEEGCFAMGVTVVGNDITAGNATGWGAFAHGSARSGTPGRNIAATGQGSFAQGYANTASIIASAVNAAQFGPGTNALADTLKVGTAGLQFKGTALAPASPVNGQFWIDGSGNVIVRSGGANQNLTDVP